MSKIAVILAGGEGKRFFPLTTPKSLFPFFSRPIIDYTLKGLKDAGFNHFVIVASKNNHNEIKNQIRNRRDIKIAIQHKPKGMADALLIAEEHIVGKSVFIVNAVDFVEQKLIDLAYAQTKKPQSFIIAKEQKEYFDGGYLRFKGKKLHSIVEKPGMGKQPSNLINLVFHYFQDANMLLKLIRNTKSKKDDVYERALSRLIKIEKLRVITYDGYWQSLKFSWDVLGVSRIFLENKLKANNFAAKIHNSAQIDRNVYLGRGVKILENVVIKGPSYIGNNTVVGTNSLVVKSIIENDCVIGFSSEVTRSYLGNNSWLHRNYIGDSVLERDVSFGAGALTANFRFDKDQINTVINNKIINTKRTKFGSILGKGCQVGVNASLMPGVKIGAHAVIGPGVIQYHDVKSKKRIFAK